MKPTSVLVNNEYKELICKYICWSTEYNWHWTEHYMQYLYSIFHRTSVLVLWIVRCPDLKAVASLWWKGADWSQVQYLTYSIIEFTISLLLHIWTFDFWTFRFLNNSIIGFYYFTSFGFLNFWILVFSLLSFLLSTLCMITTYTLFNSWSFRYFLWSRFSVWTWRFVLTFKIYFRTLKCT